MDNFCAKLSPLDVVGFVWKCELELSMRTSLSSLSRYLTLSLDINNLIWLLFCTFFLLFCNVYAFFRPPALRSVLFLLIQKQNSEMSNVLIFFRYDSTIKVTFRTTCSVYVMHWVFLLFLLCLYQLFNKKKIFTRHFERHFSKVNSEQTTTFSLFLRNSQNRGLSV